MSSKIRTVQGQMWDQIALTRLTDEHDMRDVVELNHAYADCIDLAGNLSVIVPDAAKAEPTRTLPPWER